MIKSITIKDVRDKLLIKIIARKNGTYDMIRDATLKDLEIEVRNEKNEKIIFSGRE